jgi:hypothetical protein
VGAAWESQARGPGMPHSLSRSRVPVYRSEALSSMELGRARGKGFLGQKSPVGRKTWRSKPGAQDGSVSRLVRRIPDGSSASFNLEYRAQPLPRWLSWMHRIISDTANYRADEDIEQLLRSADSELAVPGAGIAPSSRRQRPAAGGSAEARPPSVPLDRAGSGFEEEGVDRAGVASYRDSREFR